MKAQAAILEYLDREGLLKKELAYQAGVVYNSLSRYMTGKTIPQKHIRKKIGAIIGVNVNREVDWKIAKEQ